MPRKLSRYGRWPAIFLSAAFFLTACGNEDPDARFANYLSRLATTLSLDIPPQPTTAPPRPPRSGKLRLAMDSAKLDTLDFLALTGCEVQVTIGKRNSSLGRMARDSQRLLLELEYLRLAPDCVRTLRAEKRGNLADQLEQARELKQSQLPALIFNATLGGEEFRSFWLASRRPGTYPVVGSSTSSAAIAAIGAQVERWLQRDYRADNWQFEIHLGAVAGGSGGVLLRELLRQKNWLDTANNVLQARMSRGPLCAASYRQRGADILPNVVQRYFIEGIQPQAAVMERRRYEMMPLITQLEAQLASALPPLYLQWQQARNQLLGLAANAPREHVRMLQTMMAPCQR